jgi:hypothetical protein
MKYPNILFVFLLPFVLGAQTVREVDFVAPLEDGYAAVKKGNTWGFIDEDGDLIVSFRSDLVANDKVTEKVDVGIASILYPIMVEGRSVIQAVKNGIPYYGFINAIGTLAIEPQFLNVSHFKNGTAFALKLEETILGRNEPLGKRVVSYSYDIVLINRDGEVAKYLAGPFHIALSPEKLKTAPPIVAKDISDNLIAVKMPDNTWSVIRIE